MWVVAKTISQPFPSYLFAVSTLGLQYSNGNELDFQGDGRASEIHFKNALLRKSVRT